VQYPEVVLRKNEERRLLNGHLWAFSNELKTLRKDLAPGTIVTLVREQNNEPFALAFYNPHSLIAARVLARNTSATIDRDFLKTRLLQSANRRALLLTRRNSARLVHGESDFMPGLIVDKFNDILSFQITSSGFEVIKDELISLLHECFSPKTLIEKNKSNLRKLEGLEQIERIVSGEEPHTTIMDAKGVQYEIDVLTGQKTGFFLDQMENRNITGDFTRKGDKVLDLFTNEGGFALNMGLAGASEVTAVDVSAHALAKVKNNWVLNGFEGTLNAVEADCFEYVQQAPHGSFDVVVVDPPALAKSKKDMHLAKRSYTQLNMHSMRLVRPEGILVSASCSHHLTRELMLEVLQDAARKARRQLTILEERGAGIDHPMLLAMPETKYLKVFYLRVH